MPGSGAGNSDTAFLFLNHPVHGSGTFVNFAEFMTQTAIEEDTFRKGSLTGVDMCHNPDITGISEGDLTIRGLLKNFFFFSNHNYQR